MIMVTNSSKSCEVMESVATSAKLITMLCIHFICSAISIPVLVFTAVKVKKFALLHKNTRSILLVYIFSLAVHSLSRVILYANTLIRFLLPRQSGCDALPSLIGCFFMRLPLNCSMFMVASSTFMIAVERSLSTAKLSNYEENRRIGPILVILQIAFVGCLVYVLYFNTVFSERVIYYCLATTVGSPWFTYVPFSILILLQISAVVILYALKNINKKIATSLREHPDLRARYNVDENLRTITIVFPFCAATCLFTSCFFSLLICVIALNASMDYPTLFTLIDGSLLLPEFALILPLIIDRMTKIVAEKKQVAFQRHITTTVDCVGSSYFSTLSYAWNDPKDENRTSLKHPAGSKVSTSRKS